MSDIDQDRVASIVRRIVRDAMKMDKLGDLTPKSVRALAEKEMSLEAGALLELKTFVSNIIQTVIVSPLPANEEPEEIKPRSKKAAKAKSTDVGSKGDKKKARRRSRDEVDSEADASASEDPPPAKKSRKSDEKPTETISTETALSVSASKEEDASGSGPHSTKPDAPDEGHADSGSELSVLIDEPPKKRKSKSKASSKKKPERRTSTSSHTRDSGSEDSKKPKGAKSAKSKEPLDKDEEQLKKLKSFVLACGVRKVWAKEFKDITSTRQQIAHVKRILADLGMNGRLSLNQAKQIKEQRELMKDLEAVQEYDRLRGSGGKGTRSAEMKETPKEKVETSDEEEEPEVALKKSRIATNRALMACLDSESD
ncbi:hypothetical protein SISSUDRAFT_807248 [Sistotremastrum suecicum HHB10207 ss-3]|uniref:DEK C-terminal domain-containing protein n=1 Tax=Sistotremastrum suecicum HHB10207 ss-3 TaxID=1314776 RepID=A0A166CX75_9AGAM|nr:hypothetical protein SISSUDRAFT_807248 [Sistotremastrum suecicum HHB10207 ss-3]